MSGWPSGREEPGPWPKWLTHCASIIAGTDIEDSSRNPSTVRKVTRCVIPRPGADENCRGGGPGRQDLQRVQLPWQTSERTFGTRYAYECDVEELAETPDIKS